MIETWLEEIAWYKERIEEGGLSLVSLETHSTALLYYLRQVPEEQHPRLWTKEELKSFFNYRPEEELTTL